MNAFMPPCVADVAIEKHYQAYKSFLEIGGLTITNDPEAEARVVVSEGERWDYLSVHFARFNKTNMPKLMCDKWLAIQAFNQAGIDTLPCVLPDTIQDLDSVLDIPVIVKPRLSGGGISNKAVGYRVFETGRDLATFIPGTDFFSISPNFDGQMIVQKAVALPGEEFGQLYTEGFVNGKGEVVFSAVHEIGFIDA